MQTNHSQQKFIIKSELGFEMQEMLSLGSTNPVWKISHIFKARSQPNSPAIPNFILLNSLHIESPAEIGEAFRT